MKNGILILLMSVLMLSCTNNYSTGDRVGVITKFSQKGVFWKSYEGQLNMTQTGMNSSTEFDFSIDNDNEPANFLKTLDSALLYGWKVKVSYYETYGLNWFKNRGETDYFIKNIEVLDRNMNTMFTNNSVTKDSISSNDKKEATVVSDKTIIKYSLQE